MRFRHVALIAAALVAAAFAAQVSPASAARPSAPPAAFCDTAGFSGLTRLLTPTATSRGGRKAVREPRLNETPAEVPASAKAKFAPAIAAAAAEATFPVYWHVITDEEGNGDVSDLLIGEQITVLNLGFDGFYGGARTGFQFELAGVDRGAQPAPEGAPGRCRLSESSR